MLPLAGPNFPDSSSLFGAALRTGLDRYHVIARDIRAIGGWPALDELLLDLTDAHLSRATPIAKATSKTEPGPSIRRLTIKATPLIFESVPLTLDLHAEDARCGFAHDNQHEPVLQLLQSKSGALSIEAKRSDLESLLLRLASEALAKQGAEMKSARLDFTSHSPRMLEFRANVKARIFVMNAEIVISGRLGVDDDLNFRAHQLKAEGSGMIASLATAYLQPRFTEFEKRTFPLAKFSFTDVQLHDIQLSAGETLRLEAHFGD